MEVVKEKIEGRGSFSKGTLQRKVVHPEGVGKRIGAVFGAEGDVEPSCEPSLLRGERIEGHRNISILPKDLRIPWRPSVQGVPSALCDDPVSGRVLSGEECSNGRLGRGDRRKKVFKPNAFCRQGINRRRGRSVIAVTRQMISPETVDHYVNDVHCRSEK